VAATLASILDVSRVGYPLLFLMVMAESSGFLVPGETALITAGVLASQGKLEIELVIVVAAVAAIVGDNIGYVIGRKGGRWLLERPGRYYRQRQEVLRVGEPFFERHGAKAVFFGRFVLGLRVWASWLAGITRMNWRSFVFWNAFGGICWATSVGLIAYFLGRSAGNAIKTFGLFGLVAALVGIASLLWLHRRQRKRRAQQQGRAAPPAARRRVDPPPTPGVCPLRAFRRPRTCPRSPGSSRPR